jgi:sulfur carrier protein
VVVEFNGLILTPDLWAAQHVKDGDSLEIVTIVGGGS